MRQHVDRLLQPCQWSLDGLTTACVVGGALLAAHFAKALSDLRPDSVDFLIFLTSAHRWLDGGPLYDPSGALINYNPPQFHLFVLPLALMPPAVAFVLWTLASAGTAGAVLQIARREVPYPWSAQDRRLLWASVLLAAGVGATLHLGQSSWFVALLLSLGWRAARHERWWAAGVFTGLSVALKPFLGLLLILFAVRHKWKAMLSAIASGVGSLGAGAAVFGATALSSWFRLLGGAPPREQLAYFMNGSWGALATRLALGPSVATVGAVLISVISLWAARRQPEDRAWLTVLLGTLLASPLGWIYYMPLLAGPLIAVAVQRQVPRYAWWAWPLLAFPCISRSFLQRPWPVAVTAGSMYFWGLLFLWIVTLRAASWEARSQRTAASQITHGGIAT